MCFEQIYTMKWQPYNDERKHFNKIFALWMFNYLIQPPNNTQRKVCEEESAMCVGIISLIEFSKSHCYCTCLYRKMWNPYEDYCVLCVYLCVWLCMHEASHIWKYVWICDYTIMWMQISGYLYHLKTLFRCYIFIWS